MSDAKYIPNLATLCYLIDKDEKKILLGKKKYGGAKGKVNGYGGKVEINDESIKSAAVREFKEETSIDLIDPELTSIIFFNSENTVTKETKSVNIYAYISNKWKGEAVESGEMTVEWMETNKIPFEEMWENDRLWFNIVISGKKSIIKLLTVDGKLQEIKVKFQDKLDENH